MSWMMKLSETFDVISQTSDLAGILEPIYHTLKKCDIEIFVDSDGVFKNARILADQEGETIIPITHESLTSRTSGSKPHPLSDEIKYVAKDYLIFGGDKSYFNDYYQLLSEWSLSMYSHWKVIAVRKYVEKGNVIQDLVNSGILKVGDDSCFLEKQDLIKKIKDKKQIGKLFIRWSVGKMGVSNATTWNDFELIKSWQDFQYSKNTVNGVCQISGKSEYIFDKHTGGIVPGSSTSKLISLPSKESYQICTYMGRFTDSKQVCSIGFVSSQKAHNALKWLMRNRQIFRLAKESVYYTWAISSIPLPKFEVDTYSLIDEFNLGDLSAQIPDLIEAKAINFHEIDNSRDLGLLFSQELRKVILGYKDKINATDNIFIMGLHATSDGRAAITCFREMQGSLFLVVIENWHLRYAWFQNIKKNKFMGAPALIDIACSAYGERILDKKNSIFLRNIIDRILSCMFDNRAIPLDIVNLVVQRACNRFAFDEKTKQNSKRNSKSNNSDNRFDEWEKCLGVACSLYRGFYINRGYHMSLEENNISRDYLYGRLLAVGESIEQKALKKSDKNRGTNAARLMQRFSYRPYTTWKIIELNLSPYKEKLCKNDSDMSFLLRMNKLLDDITCKLGENYINDNRLEGEFLLGYHCQRRAIELYESKKTIE